MNVVPGRVRPEVAAIAMGVVGAAVIRDGAFNTADALIFPAALIALCLVSRCRIEPGWRVPLALLGALSLWWIIAALGWGTVADALPLFGSFLGFGAAAVLVTNLTPDQRGQLGQALVIGAAIFAVSGLIGLALRWDVLASRAQGLWRLSGTVSYANAAGLLLAMILPLAVIRRGRLGAVAATLISGALVATMSRGALLALALACPLVWRHLRSFWWPLLLGAGIGMVAVATALSAARQPVLLIAVIAFAAIAAARSPAPWIVAAGVVVIAIALLAVPATRSGLADAADKRMSLSQLDDRTPEWRGAWREFTADPIIGIGPERPFVARSEERTELARYAHSEPLQVAMSAGLVGLLLLLGVIGSLYHLLRSPAVRPTPFRASAGAGVLVFGIGGVADFSWHLPAIGIVGGILAATTALAERKKGNGGTGALT